MRKFQKKVSEFLFCSKNQIRSTAVTGRNSKQAYMITLAEAKGAGGSFVHKAPNQKTDMSQKRVDFLRHLLLLKLGFSTKLHLHCLHLTRLCGLCHHPSFSNSGNVSGHHLAGSNKTGCWLSLVSFVASFSSVLFCHPCHLSSYSRWLCPFIWT